MIFFVTLLFPSSKIRVLWELSVYGQCAEFAVFAPESLSPHGKTFHKNFFHIIVSTNSGIQKIIFLST